jgi:Flp pilus assembly protein TadB
MCADHQSSNIVKRENIANVQETIDNDAKRTDERQTNQNAQRTRDAMAFVVCFLFLHSRTVRVCDLLVVCWWQVFRRSAVMGDNLPRINNVDRGTGKRRQPLRDGGEKKKSRNEESEQTKRKQHKNIEIDSGTRKTTPKSRGNNKGNNTTGTRKQKKRKTKEMSTRGSEQTLSATEGPVRTNNYNTAQHNKNETQKQHDCSVRHRCSFFACSFRLLVCLSVCLFVFGCFFWLVLFFFFFLVCLFRIDEARNPRARQETKTGRLTKGAQKETKSSNQH